MSTREVSDPVPVPTSDETNIAAEDNSSFQPTFEVSSLPAPAKDSNSNPPSMDRHGFPFAHIGAESGGFTFLAIQTDDAKEKQGKDIAVKPATDAEIKQMIENLGDQKFPVRNKSSNDLAAVGARALPFLQEALKSEDPDVRRRATTLIDARMSKQEPYSVLQWMNALNDKSGGVDFAGKGAYTKVPEVLYKDLSPKQSAEKQAELSALAAILKDDKYNGAHSKTPDLAATFEQQITDLKFVQVTREMVKTLDLRNTDVSDKESAQLKALPHLTSLNLAGQPISDKGLSDLKDFPSLKQLNLHATKISDAGLAELAKSTTIEDLDISGTEGVTDKGLAHLRELSNLKSLGLFATNITDDGLARLTDNKKLEKLDLGRTGITDKGLAHLAALPALKELSLYHSSSVTDAGLAHLKDLKGLEKLDLNSAMISDKGVVNLKGLTKLRYLNLNDTGVGDLGMEAIQGLTNLKTLNVNHTHVTDKGMESISKLKNLERLGVADTKLSDKGLGQIKDLKSLKLLELMERQGSPEIETELQKALPKLQIDRLISF